MKTDTAKKLVDSFHHARHFLMNMPPLEDGLTPAAVHAIDIISQQNAQNHLVTPSEISDEMKLARPGVTRTLKQLKQLKMIEKVVDENDARSFGIRLTKRGKKVYEKYVAEYYDWLTSVLKDIPDKEAKAAAKTVTQVCLLAAEHPFEGGKDGRKK